MRLLLAGLLTALGLSAAAAADPTDLWNAIEAGNDLDMATYVEDHYRDAGASLNDGLTWSFEPYDIIVNYYSDDELLIVLGAMPAADEVAPYWRNWSNALTGGQWDPAAFFADETEARRLARFNQFVLAAHEYGHALSYRYDPRHVERHDYAVNCREFYADRLSTAMVTEATADPKLAALQARYVALMASFNAAIPAPAHYDIALLDQLQADCASVHVDQPTADTMAPYASAFFERQRLLLAAGPAPLADIYATSLFPPLAERSPPGSGFAGGVETLGLLDQITGAPTPEGSRRFPILAPDGIFLVEIDATGRASYGRAGEELSALPFDPNLKIESATGFTPDHLMLTANDWREAELDVRLYDIRRTDGAWAVTEVEWVPEELINAYVIRDPTDGAYLVSMSLVGDHPALFTRTAFDPETLAPEPAVVLASSGLPLAVGPNGEYFVFEDHAVWVETPGGGVQRFAGNLLQGAKDNADPLAAEFFEPPAGLSTVDGGLLLFDRHPLQPDSFIIRGIAPAAPVN